MFKVHIQSLPWPQVLAFAGSSVRDREDVNTVPTTLTWDDLTTASLRPGSVRARSECVESEILIVSQCYTCICLFFLFENKMPLYNGIEHMVKDHSDSEKETHSHHYMSYSFRLAARVLLYVLSYRQDSTYHSHISLLA